MKYSVYSKDGCPYCNKIEKVLQLTEQEYVVYKLNRDFTHQEFYEKFGQGSTFPQVVLNVEGPHDGTHLGGCTETVKYLKENNIV